MNAPRAAAAWVAVAFLILGSAAPAQDLPPDYIPLFSKKQIEQASPQAKARMIETEERNRAAWIERSKRSSGGDTPSAQKQSEKNAPTVARGQRKKIYRWTDADGRVNFGDTPPKRKHEEVKVRSTRPAAGARTRARIPGLLTEND